MRIDLQDPELLRLIAIEEERERRLQEELAVGWKKVSVPSIEIEDAESELEGDDIALALFSSRATYTEDQAVVSVVVGEGTATEQSFSVPTVTCKKKINSDERLRGDGIIAPLPPSRRDPSVSGQMKIAIDVALTLKDLRHSDKVIVIGSSVVEGFSGESYRLLAGRVATVDLYDPGEPETKVEVIQGTRFSYHREKWPEGKEIVADAVFVDAFDIEKGGALIFPITARVYSVKDARYPEAPPYEKPLLQMYPTAKPYVQLSQTSERRWTNTDRKFHNYAGRLGSCAACREVDYRARYEFTPFQYDVWVSMHAYGVVRCSISTHIRPPHQTNISTLIWRTTVSPVALLPYNGKDIIEMVDRQDPPVTWKQTMGFEWHDRIYVYAEREEGREGEDDRPPGARFPENLPLPRSAVVLVDLPGQYALEGSPKSSSWAVLVVDSYVYALAYTGGDSKEGRRERWIDGVVRVDYVYGPVVSLKPIGQWFLYRFEQRIATGVSPAMLAMRVLLTRRTRDYKNFSGEGGRLRVV